MCEDVRTPRIRMRRAMTGTMTHHELMLLMSGRRLPRTILGRHRVVIVGGGFGGLLAARSLKDAPVEVTLVDRRNFHLFQPLLYQVATGSLALGEIASPLRGVLRHQANTRVVLAEVSGFDLERRRVLVDRTASGHGAIEVPYDTLVVAAGARHSYFGHDEWEPAAPGLKSIEDALEIRRRILLAFEAAEVETDAVRRGAWLTFVVVGAGPTGVELAGQIVEIANDTMRHDFRRFDPTRTRVYLVEAADRVLGAFSPDLSQAALDALHGMGVTVLLGEMVTDIVEGQVTTRTAGGAERVIEARTIMWAAGVEASGLAGRLAEQCGAEVDRAGRIHVLPDLTLPGHPEVFAIGDMAHAEDPATGRLLPGVAPVAMQQGEHVGATIAARLAGRPTRPFRYRDKGNLATIGRAKAVAELPYGKATGLLAWILWLLVHIMYLIGFQNRMLVLMRWAFSFFTHGRGARLITAGVRGSALPAAEDDDATLHGGHDAPLTAPERRMT
ncbi:MAG: NAD(P)/FAD-dependent oxidoreductase [Actinomycetota bacterium]